MARFKKFRLLIVFLIFVAPLGQTDTRVRDIWVMHLYNGHTLGYSHRMTDKVGDGLYHTSTFQKLAVARSGQVFTVSRRDEWVEGDELVRVTSITDMNGSILTVRAQRIEGGLEVTVDQQGRTNHEFIPTEEKILGVYLSEKKLEELISKEIDRVEYSSFLVDPQKIVRVFLSAHGVAELQDSKGRDYRGMVVSELTSILPGVESQMVVNRQGEVLFSQTLGLGFEDIRLVSDPSASHLTDFPLFEVTTLGIAVSGLEKVTLPLYKLKEATFRFYGEGIQQLTSAVIRFHGESAVREAVLSDDTQVDSGYVQIRLANNFVGVDVGNHVGEEKNDYLGDGFHLHLSDHRLEGILAGCRGSLSVQSSDVFVECLRAAVYDYITDKSMGFGFASTDEILDARAGDCTEHSVLLVSLLRKRNIPSRIAYGFILSEQGFSGHAWSEILLDEGWYAVDSSFPPDQSQRIKIKIGYLDPAKPVWDQLEPGLLSIVGQVAGELIEWDN